MCMHVHACAHHLASVVVDRKLAERLKLAHATDLLSVGACVYACEYAWVYACALVYTSAHVCADV